METCTTCVYWPVWIRVFITEWAIWIVALVMAIRIAQLRAKVYRLEEAQKE